MQVQIPVTEGGGVATQLGHRTRINGLQVQIPVNLLLPHSHPSPTSPAASLKGWWLQVWLSPSGKEMGPQYSQVCLTIEKGEKKSW